MTDHCSLLGCVEPSPYPHEHRSPFDQVDADGRLAGVAMATPDPDRPPAAPRTFNLVRYDDVSNVSGTGVVGQGCQFRDGHVALRWCVPTLPSTWNLFESLEDLLLLNGHNGQTVVKWTGE